MLTRFSMFALTRRRVVFLCCAALCHLAGTPRGKAQTAEPAPTWLGAEARIAWVGDSITHACRWTRFVEDYLLTRYPEKKLTFWNAGVSGDRARNVVSRYREDIAAFRPTHALVMLGMNDGEVADWDDDRFAYFERDMEDLVWKLQRDSCRVALLGPTPFDEERRAQIRPDKPVPNYDHVLVRYGEWLRGLAKRKECEFVDAHAALAVANRAHKIAHPKESLIPDGVHPGELGSAFVALQVVESLFDTKERGVLVLAVEKGGLVRRESSGVAFFELVETEGGRSFRMRASSLPWTLLGESRGLAPRSEAYRRCNRFLLRCEGLEPGSHWLLVEGRRALLRTARQWKDGVDLTTIAAHPDQRAASGLAELNRQRNSRIASEIRDLMYAKKVVAMLTHNGQTQTKRYVKYRDKLEKLTKEHEANIADIGSLREKIEALRRTSTVRYSFESHR